MIRRALLAIALLASLAPAIAQAPPPVPALPDSQRLTTYTITSSTCACAVGFQIYGDGSDYGNWISVYVNGVLQPPSTYTLTSATGPLATIPRPITDAVVTFSGPQTGTVQIIGARRPRRLSQFPEGRGVAARDLNQALTDIVAQNRENWDKVNNIVALNTPPGAAGQFLVGQSNSVAAWESLSGDVSSVTAAGVLTLGKVNGIPFSSAYTTNAPLIYNGTAVASGTLSGNTTKFASVSGTLTAGHCIAIDGSGNIIDGGGPCVSSASGVTPGTINQLAYYAASGSVVSGLGPVGFTGLPLYVPTFAPSVTRTLGSKLAEHVNVKDFGALCNGSNDDTAAFNAASAYLNSPFINPTGGVIEANGICKVSNITWTPPAFGVNVALQLNGTLNVTSSQGLSVPQFVSLIGTGGGLTSSFQRQPAATVQSIAGNNASFTATGSGFNLTASAVTGTIVLGGVISGTGIPPGTVVISQLSGPTGGAGVYHTNHITTALSAAVVEGPIIINQTVGGNAILNITVTMAANCNCVGILLNGSATGSGANLDALVDLSNTNVFSNGGDGIPLEVFNTFWLTARNTAFLAGTPTAGPSILFVNTPGFGANGIEYFENLTTNGWGIEVSNGILNSTEFKNWIHESTNNDPIILNYGPDANAGLNDITFIGVGIADPINTPDGFINNANAISPSAVGLKQACTNIHFVAAGIEDTPAVNSNANLCPVDLPYGWFGQFGASEVLNLGPDAQSFFIQQSGRFDGYFLGRGAAFGPQTTPWAPLNISQNPSTWTPFAPSTVTTGILDPMGNNNAGKITFSTGGGATVATGNQAMVTGGYIIAGYWSRCDGPSSTNGNTFQTTVDLLGGNINVGSGAFGTGFLLVDASEGSFTACMWRPSVGWGKVASGNATYTVQINVRGLSTNAPTDVFMPWIIYVPPTATNDDEIIRWARHLSTMVAGAPQGSAAMAQNLYVAPGFGAQTAPTTVAGLPTCNAGSEGMRAYVTDQNTAVTYRGAVTGGGSTRQGVLCSNSAWIQN